MERILGSLAAIPPGEGRTFVTNNERIAVFRTRNEHIFAVQADCPHRHGPLADGLLGNDTLVCPLHARKFNLTTGKALSGECHLRTYIIRIDNMQRIIVDA